MLVAYAPRARFGYDDSLDVFGVHGVAGLVGALLLGVFADPALGGRGDLGMAAQLGAQTLAAVATIVYTVAVSYGLLVVVRALVGLRVSEREEREGLDLAEHAETGYEL